MENIIELFNQVDQNGIKHQCQFLQNYNKDPALLKPEIKNQLSQLIPKAMISIHSTLEHKVYGLLFLLFARGENVSENILNHLTTYQLSIPLFLLPTKETKTEEKNYLQEIQSLIIEIGEIQEKLKNEKGLATVLSENEKKYYNLVEYVYKLAPLLTSEEIHFLFLGKSVADILNHSVLNLKFLTQAVNIPQELVDKFLPAILEQFEKDPKDDICSFISAISSKLQSSDLTLLRGPLIKKIEDNDTTYSLKQLATKFNYIFNAQEIENFVDKCILNLTPPMERERNIRAINCLRVIHNNLNLSHIEKVYPGLKNILLCEDSRHLNKHLSHIVFELITLIFSKLSSEQRTEMIGIMRRLILRPAMVSSFAQKTLINSEITNFIKPQQLYDIADTISSKIDSPGMSDPAVLKWYCHHYFVRFINHEPLPSLPSSFDAKPYRRMIELLNHLWDSVIISSPNKPLKNEDGEKSFVISDAKFRL